MMMMMAFVVVGELGGERRSAKRPPGRHSIPLECEFQFQFWPADMFKIHILNELTASRATNAAANPIQCWPIMMAKLSGLWN